MGRCVSKIRLGEMQREFWEAGEGKICLFVEVWSHEPVLEKLLTSLKLPRSQQTFSEGNLPENCYPCALSRHNPGCSLPTQASQVFLLRFWHLPSF